jgi:hypothetical protein
MRRDAAHRVHRDRPPDHLLMSSTGPIVCARPKKDRNLIVTGFQGPRQSGRADPF